MKELKILYLEDCPQDVEITTRILKKAGFPFSIKLVVAPDEYKQALLQYRPDIILSDHSTGQLNPIEALGIIRENNYKIPFIIVTRTVSEEFAVKILKEGADDYFLKDNLAGLPGAIHNALAKHSLEREHEQYLANVIANEALLKEAEHLANFGSWLADLSTGFVKWSDEVYRIYGYAVGEIVPDFERFLCHVHPDDVSFLKESLDHAVKNLNSYKCEFRIIDKNQKIKYINSKIVIERNAEGIPVRLIGFNLDITDRKEVEQELLRSFKEVTKLEKELVEQQLQQQKIIIEVTLEAQEKEREELGKELHDNVNQILAIIKMYLDMMRTSESAPEDLAERCYGHIKEAMSEIRKLSKTLVAPSLGHISLQEAMQELVEDINISNKLNVQFINEMHKERLMDNKMELMLYRIVQEQINNIRKHAKADEVTIRLNTNDHRLFLSITDDGVGFDMAQKAKGIGLKNIQSRVEFYSGNLKIISAPGQGCTLEVTIPMQNGL